MALKIISTCGTTTLRKKKFDWKLKNFVGVGVLGMPPNYIHNKNQNIK
jgi:hypothetical protein